MTASAVPFVFSPNTLIQSAQVNADFSAVVGSLNNIDVGQITTGVLPVSQGGTGVTTPGAITTSINAVSKAGDTMTGDLTVPHIVYTGSAYSFALTWDGTNTHVLVNGGDQGIIGHITSISAGNGLTGGGSSGAVTLAMSGSYSGNFTTNGLYGDYLHSYGNADVAGSFGVGGNAGVTGQITCASLYSAGVYGIGNWKFYVTNEIFCARHIYPSENFGVGCGGSALAWAWVESLVYYTASDPAVKRDIEPVPSGCLEVVNAIAPKTYKFSVGDDNDKTHWGFLAPEISEVMQRAGVRFDGVKLEDDRTSLAYNELIAVLWKAVQELTAKVTALEAARGAS